MATALVTGGTAGIGAAFARALAARGDDLVLVARDESRLRSVADELSETHGVRVEILVADLADRADLTRVAERLEDPERPVDLLINNAGFGLHTPLLSTDLAAHDRAFDVMCRAVLVLGGAAARGMTGRGRGTIVTISSLSAFIAQGGYSPIKAWVLAYSESLAVELHGTGVTATAVCPGWVRTEFHERAGIATGSIPDAVWVEADRMVREALADAEQGVVISVPTRRWKAAHLALRHAPRSTVRWISRILIKSRA